jgi:ADP-ribose pyrophosphatase
MKAQDWQRVEPTEVINIGFRDAVNKTFIIPGTDKTMTFTTFLTEGIEFAGVIALTKDRQVIVARQFRQGPEKIMDELPGGGVEAGEDKELAARRELLEETGYEPGAMEYIGMSTRDAYSNGKWYYYLATDCVMSAAGPALDEAEPIEVRLISIKEFIDNAKHDKLSDSVAVLMAYDKLMELRS